MATATHRVITPDTGNTPNTSGNITFASGDLLVVFVTKEASALSSPMVSGDLTVANVTGVTSFTLIRTQGHQSSAAHMGVFVADQLTTGSGTTGTVTIGSGSDAGAGTIIGVYTVAGMGSAGSSAVRQSGGQTDQSAGTPAPAFGQAALTANLCLGAIYNATNPAGMTPPGSWSEGGDSGYTTGQVSGLETCHRNSGETGTTITWGSSSASAFASIIIELTTSVTETPTPGGGLAAGSAPLVLIATTIAGALASGVAAVAGIGMAAQGALASGPAPATAVAITSQGALAGGLPPAFEGFLDSVPAGGGTADGVSPTSAVATTIAGGTADGQSPSPALVSISAGGALAGGVEPTESSGTSETPTPGGALADGVTPTSAIPATADGAAATGVAPTTAQVTVAAGGALAAGSESTSAAGIAQGGAIASGAAPSGVVVLLTAGGAVAGGYGPAEPGQPVNETPPPGGAIAGGNSPVGLVPATQGGVDAAGVTPSGSIIPVASGGALAGGVSIVEEEPTFEAPDTGYLVFTAQGRIVRLELGHIARSLTGRRT